MPLHPTIVAMLAQMREAGRPALSAGTPEDARRMMAAARAALGRGPEVGMVRDLRIPTRSGAIAARLFQPSAPAAGLVVYVHGGGWMLGSLEDFDALARTLAERSGCAVLLPDYRLAPEHPFPAGLEDVEDAVLWAGGEREALAGAAAPLIAAGDSAGANLATVALTSLAGRMPVAAQILVYPVTDSDLGRASYAEFSEGLLLTRQDMIWFFGHYAAPDRHGDPRISPFRAAEVDGLPPAVVVTAEFDVLRDEGEAYAGRLAAAGRLVASRRIEGLPHGFIRMHNLVDAADRAVSDIAADMRRLCAAAATPGGMIERLGEQQGRVG